MTARALLTMLLVGLLQPVVPATAAPESPSAPARDQRLEATVQGDLRDPAKKEIAMQLVSSAENSSLRWRQQYRYIEDIGDGRGYTAGIIGFCSGTGDMLQLVQAYTRAEPDNVLARYLPALRRVDGSDSHAGLGRGFVQAWRVASKEHAFRRAQDHERDRVYFRPAVRLAVHDGLAELGQFAYYDAAVVHGYAGLRAIRKRALSDAKVPSRGATEESWLRTFLDERILEMNKERAHAGQLDRITKTQQRFLRAGNLALDPPLRWTVNQTHFRIRD